MCLAGGWADYSLPGLTCGICMADLAGDQRWASTAAHPAGSGSYASDPGTEAEAEAVQAAGGLTTKDIDLPAVQAHCRSQTDQHYDDCVTVNQVIDALAGNWLGNLPSRIYSTLYTSIPRCTNPVL